MFDHIFLPDTHVQFVFSKKINMAKLIGKVGSPRVSAHVRHQSDTIDAGADVNVASFACIISRIKVCGKRGKGTNHNY